MRFVMRVANRVHESGRDDEDHQTDLIQAGTELGGQDVSTGEGGNDDEYRRESAQADEKRNHRRLIRCRRP